MTALAADKARRTESWKYKSFTLASGNVAYKGGRAALNSSGKVVPVSASTSLFVIGSFAEAVDATSADKPCTVQFDEEITVERLANATAGDACASSDVGKLCYALDDQTVTITASGHSIAGRIWDVDSTKGVAVEVLKGPSAAPVEALGTTSNLVGVDGIGNNAAPLAGTESRLDAVETKVDALIAALKTAGLMKTA